MIRLLYNIILFLIAPFFLYSLYKKKPGKPSVDERWKEHFGLTPKLELNQKPLWIHAASVGETIAVTPFIKKIKNQFPEITILLTTTTPTGAEQANKLGNLIIHRYTPLDFPWAIKSFLKRIKPSQLIIVETELWPNLLNITNQASIPITLLNARLSEKSYQSYRKLFPLFKPMGKQLSKVLCQYNDDAERFTKLGINKNKIIITGSIKFDISVSQHTINLGHRLRERLGKERPIWIAASTHSGEDEIILSAHKDLLADKPDALLILVPRHPERFLQVTSIAKNSFSSVTRSSREIITDSTQVYIGDTMGEMLELIGAADVCFMGGSLVGNKVGGHNLLEPAALAIPTLIGPSFYNFQEITQQLIAKDACHIIKDSKSLFESLLFLFNNELARVKQGKIAFKFIQSNSGALERTIRLIDIE